MSRWLRITVTVLFMLFMFVSFTTKVSHAQTMLPLTVSTVYMQVNTPNTGGSPHSLTLPCTTRRNVFGNCFSPEQQRFYDSWGQYLTNIFTERVSNTAVYRDPNPRRRGSGLSAGLRMGLCLEQRDCKLIRSGTTSRRAQQDGPPYKFTDPETGSITTINENGYVVITSPAGEVIAEFELTTNYLGDPIVEVEGDDGSIYRESLDGYTLEIEPDGENCTMSDGINEYDLELDEDGILVYYGPDGYVLEFEHDSEDGTLYTYDSDGNYGEFYEGGEYAFYDEEGNLLKEGKIDNPTVAERSEELGYDLSDPDQVELHDDSDDDLGSEAESNSDPADENDDAVDKSDDTSASDNTSSDDPNDDAQGSTDDQGQGEEGG